MSKRDHPDSITRALLKELDTIEHQQRVKDSIVAKKPNTYKPRSRSGNNGLFIIRNVRNLQQSELAQRVGVSTRTINAIENQLSSPSVYLALAIAEALNMRVEDIFSLKA